MPLLPFPTGSTIALVAVGDPGRDRTLYATIVLLVALGFALILLAAWLLRNTRPDPEVLAPLERMGQRRWRRADPVWQRRHLDEVRPGGADPLEPTSAPPATDADFERGPQPIGFDDLVVSSAPSTTAAAGLPAPSAEAQVVEGPLDPDHGDEQTPGSGDAIETAPGAPAGNDATSAGGDAGLVEVGEIDDAASDDAAPDATADVGTGGDDDEDITGEQDTDDFLAVLDQEPELDADVELDVEPESDPVVGPEAHAHVEPEPGVEPEDDHEVEPDAEPEPDDEPEPGVEPEDDHVHSNPEPAADSKADHDAESDIDDDDNDEPG